MTPLLRWTLRASAVYDLSALALLLAMPSWLFAWFAHPVPADPFLFRLAALPLWMAPVVYAMASMQAQRDHGLVAASVALRLIGAVGIAVLLVWHRPAGAMAYWTFVSGDIVWALAIEVQRRGASR